MEIDRQIQKMKVNKTIGEYENASKFRYVAHDYLIDYFNQVIVVVLFMIF